MFSLVIENVGVQLGLIRENEKNESSSIIFAAEAACCLYSFHQLLIVSLLVYENSLTFHEERFKGKKHAACEL